MKRFCWFVLTCLAMAGSLLLPGNSRLSAQPPPEEVKPAARQKAKVEPGDTYRRRLEANKRLKEAVEARKAGRLAGTPAVTGKEGKGVPNE